MKSPIFDKKFEEIFTPERLAFEAKEPIDVEDFFDFAPHTTFLIPKNENEFRPISVPDKKLKIIQKILANELTHVLKFSDRSYAYQKGKSPVKAINRVKNIVNGYEFVLKCDIDSFFDTIEHDRLVKKLKKIILDEKIIYLIWLFLKNGALFHYEWVDKLEGVYQGDVLSPLLSNIYLHSFDVSCEKRGIEFVRYADDLIFFANSYKEAQKILRFIQQRLAIEKLSLDPSKTNIVHKSKSFEYLGVRFYVPQRRYSIDNDRLMQKISKISKETRSLSFSNTLQKIKEFIEGFRNYYFQVVNDTKQFETLQRHIDEILVRKIVHAKSEGKITRKKEFLQMLSTVKPLISYENYSYHVVQKAYELLKLKNPKKSAIKEIEGKKRTFFKNILKQTELIVTQTGTALGFRQGEIVVKLHGQIQKRFALRRIKRIVITNIKTSISTYLIYMCAKEKIDIDFIHDNTPFALLTYAKTVTKELHLKQLKLTLSPKGLFYAKNLHFAKAKNQINLIKYFNRRRNDEQLASYVEKMEELLPKIKRAKDSKTLMAIEAQISAAYWKAFGRIAGVENFHRVHQNAPDAINQALNYGYAILYNRIQSALVKEGLNLYYSFLHATDYKKPTLVFDMVEPFRQPIVDREILSILTKKQKLHSNKGKLTSGSVKLVTQNIQERLASFTKTKYGKTTYLQLITFEANALKRAIEKEADNHRFFIAKY